MTSSAQQSSLPTITLKKLPNAGDKSDISHSAFQNAKVMNTGDRGMSHWRRADQLLMRVDIKGEVGPRVLRFLETPVAVIDLESGREIEISPGGNRQKRKREG